MNTSITKIIKKTSSIIKYVIFILFFLELYLPVSYSQVPEIDSKIMEKAINGVSNITSSIISDSFIPVTHWEKEEYSITGVPSYFNVETAYDDPEVKGDDLKGWTMAIGGAYTLTDKILSYAIFAGMDISGDLKGNLYGEELPVICVQTDYRLYAFLAGIGYDLIPGNNWLSIPVYAGPFIQHYKMNLDFPETGTGTASLKAKVSGDGFLYGISGGFAISALILDRLKITPYFLYLRSINGPGAKAESTSGYTNPLPPFNYVTLKHKESLELDYINTSLIGLSLKFAGSGPFSFSVSIGGYLTSETDFYNEKFLNGLKMKSIVLAMTYTHKRTETEW